jgi:hypothetical protein
MFHSTHSSHPLFVQTYRTALQGFTFSIFKALRSFFLLSLVMDEKALGQSLMSWWNLWPWVLRLLTAIFFVVVTEDNHAATAAKALAMWALGRVTPPWFSRFLDRELTASDAERAPLVPPRT